MAQMLDPSLASQLQGTGPGGMPTQADAAQAQAKQAEAESQRQDILTKVMAPDAKERLARISLVKPDKVPPPAPRAARSGRRPRLPHSALGQSLLRSALD